MKNYQVLLFDFDYTLVDSSAGIVQCAQYAFSKMGFHISADQVRESIGLPLPEKYQTLTGDLNIENALHFRDTFMQKQDEVMTANTVLFSSVKPFLDAVSRQGLQVAIVSTKTSKPIHELLVREQIQHHFTCVIGGEHVTSHKPDPEGAHLALRSLSIDPREALFIGDSIYDAGTAKNAGIDFVATLTGTTPASAFDAYPCLAQVKDLSELLDGGRLMRDSLIKFQPTISID